jgi:hypothetical protein
MRIPKSILIPALALIIGSLGCGPIGPFAGGRLRGDTGPADVHDWSFADDEDLLQLETRPSDPHSVNTWFATIGPKLYVPTSMLYRHGDDPSKRGWVQNVEADPQARLRILGKVYDRVAVRVVDDDEYDDARNALDEKYDLDDDDVDPARVIWIFRMDPRER